MKKKVSPIPESAKGIKLEHFNLQDRSELQGQWPNLVSISLRQSAR